MREQLVTQITLGIASGDLPTGEKLPSRGEIARRFEIHANTVSNAYQELAEKNLIEFRPGSGFYVCEPKADNDFENELDTLTAKFFADAQTLGFSTDEIQNALEKHLENNSAGHFLVIESDRELREILIEEIRSATNRQVAGIGFDEFRNDFKKLEAIFVALSDEEEKIQSFLPAEKNCVFLKSNSVVDALVGETRPAEEELIAVVSGWKNFLLMAKTILVAAKIDADSIVLRLTSEKNWQRGLENASMIICDSLTAKKSFPTDTNVRPFPLISELSKQNLCRLIGNNK